MRNLAFAAGLLLLVSLVAGPAVLADTTTINATQITVTGPGGTAGNLLGVTDGSNSPSGAGTGVSYTSTGFDSGSGFGSSTYGSFTVTITAATSGTYYVGGFFDPDLAVDFYNEYATVHGTAGSDQSWEVNTPVGSSLDPTGTLNDALNNTLTNTNNLPGQLDNALENCTGPTCNGDVALAMGFSESLTAGQVETVTFSISSAPPTGGFYIDQTHPVDGQQGLTSPVDAYFSGSVSIASPCTGPNCGGGGGTGMPEPGSLVLLGTALCGLLGVAKKFAN